MAFYRITYSIRFSVSPIVLNFLHKNQSNCRYMIFGNHLDRFLRNCPHNHHSNCLGNLHIYPYTFLCMHHHMRFYSPIYSQTV